MPSDTLVESAVRAAMRPPDRRPAWQWCEENVVVDDTSAVGAGELWRSDASPWSRRILEAFGQFGVTEVTFRTCAQGAKSQTALGAVCWAIAEDPGPMLWVTASRDDVKMFIETRITPTLTECAPVRKVLREVGDGSTKGFYKFDGGTFELVGAGSPSKLQSRPIRYLILDEMRNYPAGATELARKRTRTYEKTKRAKTLIITTGGEDGDAVDMAFKAGTQEHWHYPCEGCGASVPLKFGDITGDTPPLVKWGDADDPKHTRYKDDAGRWLYDKLAPTIRHCCPSCGHAHYDVPATRRHITGKGGFVAANPGAPSGKVSGTFSALLPEWVEWRKIVEEFIDAMGAMKLGNIEPLIKFVTETLGESWADRLRDFKFTDRLTHLRGDYAIKSDVPLGWRLFMGADRQAKDGDHYWYVVRAFSETGESRLIDYGKVAAGEGLEGRLDDVRKMHGVDPRYCCVDSGYKATDTYRACVLYGWTAMKGDDAKYYMVTDDATGERVQRNWDVVYPEEYRLVARGVTMPLIRWSNDKFKDAMAHLMTGMAGAWTISKDADDEYCRQITAEQREEVAVGQKTTYRWKKVRRDDHMRDCELMILVAAIGTGALSIAVPEHAGASHPA